MTVRLIRCRICSRNARKPSNPLGRSFVLFSFSAISFVSFVSSFFVDCLLLSAGGKGFDDGINFSVTIWSPLIPNLPRAYRTRGVAEAHTDMTSRMPISSESSICCSLAPASSSLAMAKDTANERSDPIEERASEGNAIALANLHAPSSQSVQYHHLYQQEVAVAAREEALLGRDGQVGPLRIRRFIFSKSGPYSKPPQIQKCREGVRDRRKASSSSSSSSSCSSSSPSPPSSLDNDDLMHSRNAVCFAATFGSTLKTVLDFAGLSAEKTAIVAKALDDIAFFLDPATVDVSQIGGSDREHLVNGLGSHSVSSKQAKTLEECDAGDVKTRRSYLFRSGRRNVTFGATAAILVAHYVLAVTGYEPHEVVENLSRSISVTRQLLQNWDSSSIKPHSMYQEALGAEIRALERARASAQAAEKVAKQHGMDRLTSLHLQLSYMRSAAWPARAVCEAGETHAQNLKRLSNGELITQPQLFLPSEPPCTDPMRDLRAASSYGGSTYSGSSSSSSYQTSYRSSQSLFSSSSSSSNYASLFSHKRSGSTCGDADSEVGDRLGELMGEEEGEEGEEGEAGEGNRKRDASYNSSRTSSVSADVSAPRLRLASHLFL